MDVRTAQGSGSEILNNKKESEKMSWLKALVLVGMIMLFIYIIDSTTGTGDSPSEAGGAEPSLLVGKDSKYTRSIVPERVVPSPSSINVSIVEVQGGTFFRIFDARTPALKRLIDERIGSEFTVKIGKDNEILGIVPSSETEAE